METFFGLFFLNARRGSSEVIWPLRVVFTVSLSLILADFHPVKLGVKNVKSVLIKNLGPRNGNEQRGNERSTLLMARTSLFTKINENF